MLLTIKITALFMILLLSSFIGYLISNKYSQRVKELEDIVSALDLLETRVKYTYDTICDSFEFVADNMATKAYRIFMIAAGNLKSSKNVSAGDVFRNTVDEEGAFLNITKEDSEIIKGLGNSLGQVDLEGQIKNIVLVRDLTKRQLNEATEMKNKNYKLSRNMGVFVGLVIMIILI